MKNKKKQSEYDVIDGYYSVVGDVMVLLAARSLVQFLFKTQITRARYLLRKKGSFFFYQKGF